MGRFLFREGTVTAVRTIGRFRHVEVAGDALKGVDWTPGDKVQVFLAGDMRTYTPITWDKAKGETSLLLYVHGDAPKTPGAAWAARLEPGAKCSFFGPRSSIAFPDLADDAIFAGDETSFAAACALHAVKKRAANVFEVDDAAEAKEALAAFGLDGATVLQRERADKHLEAMAKVLVEEQAARPTATITMTGRAQTIQVLRAHLKSQGQPRLGKSKAYWSVGKAGLD